MEIKVLPTSLARLVDYISTAIKHEEKLTPLRARELVLAADVQEEDMMQYADFDHPIEDCYGRKMVHDNGNFEVMVMSWNPNHYSSIHNHGYTEWGVVQAFGNVHHFIYKEKDGRLIFSKKEILPKGAAIQVNNKFIHQMGNPSSGRYLTLHVYGCNERQEDVTADAKSFDLEHDRISHTTGGAFFNLPAELIYEFEPCPVPSRAVFMNYLNLLLLYYSRQSDTEEMRFLKKSALAKMEHAVMNMPA